jgi:hypothetical protein
MVMTFETFRHRDKIPNRLDAQFNLIRVVDILLCCYHRDQQGGSITMLDLK